MKKKLSLLISILLVVVLVFLGVPDAPEADIPTEPAAVLTPDAAEQIDIDGSYTSAEDVALYL